jgi:hypothetical protein
VNAEQPNQRPKERKQINHGLPIEFPAWGEALNSQNLYEAPDNPVKVKKLSHDQDNRPNRYLQIIEG